MYYLFNTIREQKAEEIQAILEEYNLGTKSNISRIKTALRDRELIDITKDGIYLEDPVFKLWLRNK